MRVLTKGKLFLLLLASSNLTAQEEVDSLFSMSLEELLNVKIITVSHDKEKIGESLAVVSVLTSTQLKQMGALNLYEALSFVPGIVLNETYMGFTTLTFRGVTPGLYNNKALFMINGHPAHEKLFGSSHLEYIPLDIIDRIEVVRSPASVLYGTNAISGVVNVITKQGKDIENSISARVGSNQHYYSGFAVHGDQFSISGSIQNDDGYKFTGTVDELGQVVSKDYQNDISNLFVDIYGEQWRVNAAYFQSKKEKFGLSPINQHGGTNNFDAFYLNANKRFELDSGTINTWLRYDSMDKVINAQSFPNPFSRRPIKVQNSLSRYSAEINYKTHYLAPFNYIIGLNFEYDTTEPMLFIDKNNNNTLFISPISKSYSTENIAFYTEGKYVFSESWVGIAGFRFEHNSDTDTDFNPRLGLNYQYHPDTYIKLLYSEAYRSPTFHEKYADVPSILLGSTSLMREKIKTIELGVDSKINKKLSLQATLFHLQLSDEISLRPTLDGGAEFINASGRDMTGYELALNTILNRSTELIFNTSYTNGDENSEDVSFISNITANAILTHHLAENWSVSLSNQYVGSKDYYTNVGDTGKIAAYNLTNISLTYITNHYEINLLLKNIFDEQYTFPEPVRRNISEIPGGAGATVYLTGSYNF